MPMPIAPLPALKIATLPRRLEADEYPIRTSLRIRWSDIQEERVSRVAMAHFFEDIRVFSIEKFWGSDQSNLKAGDAVLRAVTIEHLAAATLDTPFLEVAAGISSIGKSSFTYALAAFQNGRCVAVGSSVDVRVVDGQAAAWDADLRARLERYLLPTQVAGGAGAAAIHPKTYPWSCELRTRFADTDLVGHLNNVAMSRYHDNAAMAFIREALGHTRPDAAGLRLAIVRQELSLELESFFPGPITLSVAVQEIQPQCFTLALATFQNGQRTSASTAVVAWVDAQDQSQPLPAQLAARLPAFQST